MAVSHPLIQMLAAALGTLAFAVLFGVPVKMFLSGAVIGGLGWLLYTLLEQLTVLDVFLITFLATVLVVLLSRFVAVQERCPATVFVTCGILPLVPGAGIYWTAWYMLSQQSELAAASGLAAVKVVFGIVLGIVVVFELPQKVFQISIKH